MKKPSCLSVVAAIVLFLCSGAAIAKYPDKPITLIIPFNPGGQSDVAARLLIPALEKALGVNVVPQYRVGAGGAVGWAILSHKRADGYTMAITNLPHIIIQPLMIEGTGYDTGDLAPVYVYATTPGGVAVPADSRFKSMQDLIDYAKANPGRVTVAGTGTYTGNNLGFLELEKAANIKLSYVNFTGAAPQAAAVLGHQTDAIYGGTFIFSNHLEKIRPLAFSIKHRVDQFPDVPTFKELGYNVFEGIDRGVTVPSGTPRKRVKILADAMRQATSRLKYKKKMHNLGFTLKNLRPKGFRNLLHQRAETYISALVQTGHLDAEKAKSYQRNLKKTNWYK